MPAANNLPRISAERRVGDEQLGEHAGVAFPDDRWQPP
jgi:hypothetical protein